MTPEPRVSIDGCWLAIDTGALELRFIAASPIVPVHNEGGAMLIRDNELRLAHMSLPGKANVLAPAAQPQPLWRAELIRPDGTRLETDSTHFAMHSVTARQTDCAVYLAFVWIAVRPEDTGLAAAGTAWCEAGSPVCFWSVEMAPAEPGWRVLRTDLLLPDIALRPEMKMAVPSGWGVECGVKDGTAYEATYPSCSAVMQFLAFYGGGASGVYLGVHDAQANHKQFRVDVRDKRVSYAMTQWHALDAENGTPGPGGVATIGVFDGGYVDAARIYRGFALATPWAAAARLHMPRIPQWLTDTDLWLRPDGSAEANVEVTLKALEYFGAEHTACHWYRWHEIPYDTKYPEYFPPLPGFAEGIRALQQAGTRVMPYINGRLWDPDTESWAARGAADAAVRNEDGSFFPESYPTSNVQLNVMCPATPLWRATVADLVDRLVKELGVDGVYIDQIGAAYAVRCFAENHEHAPGGGHFWHDGYRRMLADIRAALPEGRMLTTEENIECFIDQFDALLVVNTPTNSGVPIPLFPAVYSELAVTFGFQYLPPDDLQRGLPFRVKMARAFCFGAQLGWIQPARIMAPEAADEAAFLRNLVRCRAHARPHIVGGRFLGMVDLSDSVARLTGEASGSFGGVYRIDEPAVIASAWQSPSGATATLLVNIDADNEWRVKVPVHGGAGAGGDSGGKPAKPRITAHGSGGKATARSAGKDAVSVTVPPSDAVVLVVQ